MRRILIDTFRLTGATGNGAYYSRKTSLWYLSRPRLLTTLLGFLAVYTWLNFGGHEILIPRDSWQYVKDGSVTDIMNTTLGVGEYSSVALWACETCPTYFEWLQNPCMD